MFISKTYKVTKLNSYHVSQFLSICWSILNLIANLFWNTLINFIPDRPAWRVSLTQSTTTTQFTTTCRIDSVSGSATQLEDGRKIGEFRHLFFISISTLVKAVWACLTQDVWIKLKSISNAVFRQRFGRINKNCRRIGFLKVDGFSRGGNPSWYYTYFQMVWNVVKPIIHFFITFRYEWNPCQSHH